MQDHAYRSPVHAHMAAINCPASDRHGKLYSLELGDMHAGTFGRLIAATFYCDGNRRE